MKRVFLLGCLILGAAVVGCGGGGIDGNKKVSALDDSEAKEVCTSVKAESKDCGNGLTLSRDPTKCEASVKAAPETCTATVADFDACNAVPVCDTIKSAECAKFFACAGAM